MRTDRGGSAGADEVATWVLGALAWGSLVLAWQWPGGLAQWPRWLVHDAALEAVVRAAWGLAFAASAWVVWRRMAGHGAGPLATLPFGLVLAAGGQLWTAGGATAQRGSWPGDWPGAWAVATLGELLCVLALTSRLALSTGRVATVGLATLLCAGLVWGGQAQAGAAPEAASAASRHGMQLLLHLSGAVLLACQKLPAGGVTVRRGVAGALILAAAADMAGLMATVAAVPALAALTGAAAAGLYLRSLWRGLGDAGMCVPATVLATGRQESAPLDGLLTDLPLRVLRCDHRGQVRFANDQAARLAGTGQDALLGRDLVQLPAFAELGAQVARFLRDHGARHATQAFEVQHAAGEARMLRADLIRLGGGDAQARPDVVVVLTDITSEDRSRKALEAAVRELNELRRAVDAHAIVAVTDARGVITHVNDQFCAISGHARAELVGQTHRVVNSGQHPKSFFVDLWRSISAGRVWTGDIQNRAKDGSTYWVHTTIAPICDASGQPQRYISIRHDITARKHAEEHALRLAFYDALTGLPNRRLLADRLGQAIALARRSGSQVALLLLDLDDFKNVNDSLGHDHGDELLRIVSQRIVHQVRDVDTVARMGGDEFVIVLSGLGQDRQTAVERATHIAEKIVGAVGQPCNIRELEIQASTSIGVALLPDDGCGADDLLKRADMAMYRAKALGRGRVALFEAELEASLLEQAHVTADLRHALERQQLLLHFQPIVDVAGEVVGHEALLRWRHPVIGWVSPANFIPLAERSGLIVPLGHWVLEEACRQLAEWALHPVRRSWRLSVNVSARQLREARFGPDLIECALSHGIAPDRLKIEITEGTLLSWHDGALELLTSLQRFGFGLSLDDFGTGYSSLDYLSRLPLNEVKVDQVFVRELQGNPRAKAIVASVIDLGRNLGMRVVAEGVETAEQHEALRAMGCEFFQGYLFGRPGPLDGPGLRAGAAQ